MTPERIAQLKALCRAAPGGKWKLWTSNSWLRFKDENGVPVIEPIVLVSDGHPDLLLAPGVAPFIEEASTALPECLDEIERLRQALERLTKELRSFQSLGYFTNAHWQRVIADAEEALSQPSTPIPGKCAARSNVGANEPQDCDWPLCGCDEHANKVISVLEECGYLVEQAGQPPLCEACQVRHWPMQNTLCPTTEKTWAEVHKARGYKLVPLVPTRKMMEAGEQSCGRDDDDPYVKRGRFMVAWHDALAAAPLPHKEGK